EYASPATLPTVDSASTGLEAGVFVGTIGVIVSSMRTPAVGVDVFRIDTSGVAVAVDVSIPAAIVAVDVSAGAAVAVSAGVTVAVSAATVAVPDASVVAVAVASDVAVAVIVAGNVG